MLITYSAFYTRLKYQNLRTTYLGNYVAYVEALLNQLGNYTQTFPQVKRNNFANSAKKDSVVIEALAQLKKRTGPRSVTCLLLFANYPIMIQT